MKITKIATFIDGKLIGNKNTEIFFIYPIESLVAKEKINKQSIIYIEKEKYLIFAIKSQINTIIINSKIDFNKYLLKDKKNIILVDSPKTSFFKLLKLFEKEKLKKLEKNKLNNPKIGKESIIMQNSFISPGTIIGEKVIIYPNCYIGDEVEISEGTIIYANVSISHSKIGKYNKIYNGAVIGSIGFSYINNLNENLHIPHIGIVKTGNEVEIGANSCIDRATIGKTLIGNRSKIDNLVQIAHNCKIGNDCYIASQVGIAGSSQIGNRVKIGGQSGISDHLHIEDDVIICGKSGVTKNIKKSEIIMGFPARPIKKMKKMISILSQFAKKYKNE